MHNKVVYQVTKTLDALGLPVLRFNFRGAGLSAGEHDNGRGEQDDVRTALDFLATEFPGVPLLLAGFSFGCWVGLRVGCEDARVSELASLGAPVNTTDFSFLYLCSKPKLFLQGSDDEHGDVNKLRYLVASIPGENQLAVIDHAEHFFAGKLDHVGAALAGWLTSRHPNVSR